MTLQEKAVKEIALLKRLERVDIDDAEAVKQIVVELVQIEPSRITNQLTLMLNAFTQVCIEVDNAEELLDVCDTVDDYDEEDYEEAL